MPAKFNLLVAASIPAVAIVPLLACGGSSSGKTDSGIIVHDSPNGSGSGSGSAVCTFPANLTPTVSAQAANYQAAGSGANPIKENELRYRGLIGGTQGSSDQQELRILIFGGCGTTGTGCTGGSAVDATPTWPTVFTPKTGLDLAATDGSGNLLHPDILLLLLGDPDATQYNTIYIAAAGTVSVGPVANGSGSAFAGSGSNLDFLHIDSTSFMQAADGCETIIPSFSWNAATFTNKNVVFVDGPAALTPDLINKLRHRTM
jgi:hypothetical protein